jgi:hypothetical protein
MIKTLRHRIVNHTIDQILWVTNFSNLSLKGLFKNIALRYVKWLQWLFLNKVRLIQNNLNILITNQ